jgi:hypothetical protein
MASAGQINQLRQYIDTLQKVDFEKLKRVNLGEESLATELEPRLRKIERLTRLCQDYAEGVHDNVVSQMAGVFNTLANALAEQAARPNQAFIAQRQAFLQTLDNGLEAARQWEPNFVTAAVEARGFLQDEGIRKEYERTVGELKSESDKTLKALKDEAERTLEGARKIAAEIETRARRTAARVSVAEAQNQFREAQRGLTIKAIAWGAGGVAATLLFIKTVVYLIELPLPEETGWHAFYHAALRLAILSIVGGVTGFTFKTFRAYLHLRERNLHRQRVANSIESFVDSAVTPEVRDVILAHLVESVVDFGISGLLSKEHEMPDTPKVPAEFVGRMLGSLTPRRDGTT